jgi:hypothetical protein
MPQPSFPRPPRLATWLIEFFISSEQAESISGDLVEEFSGLVSKTGIASARRWYWRQSVKTTAHLIGNAFRFTPWPILGAVVGGLLLLRFGSRLPEQVMIAILRTQRPYSTAHYNAYVFWVTDGIFIVQLIESLLVGCIVAAAAKSKELVATMTLGLIVVALSGVGLVRWLGIWPEHGFGVFRMLVTTLEFPFMIVAGGAVVRISRSAPPRRTSVV